MRPTPAPLAQPAKSSPGRRRLPRNLLLATLAPLLLGAGALQSSAQEFRAAWADIFHVGLTSQADVDNMVAALVAGRYNVVVAQVLGYMDNTPASHGAHWKSSIVPWSSRVTAGFDPLAYLCTRAHANGIEVHAWLGGSGGAMYRVSTAWPPAGNATLAAHPEWFIAPLANSEGNAVVAVDGMYILDMGSPDAQEYIVSIVKELVTNYPIDGINWDDEINGAGYSAGYNYPTYSQANYARSGLARFRINNGYASTYTPSNTDTAWSNYRRRFKNELMARVQAEIQSIKTNPRQPLRHTTAALAYSPVPTSCDFTGSTPYLYFCDWASMLQHGWVDAVIPQTYSTSTISNWVDRITACWQYNRQVFPGIGAYLNPNATIANHIYYLRSKGLKGYSTYSYAVANNSATPGDWWAYAAANVNPSVVSTPSMPWRNPATATEGIVWGRVTDGNTGLPVDDATVTVTGGPTVKTDGNGYYVATLVPATAGGTAHSTTASKTGMTPQTVSAIALAGDVVRYDLTLNPPANDPASITGQPQDRTVNQGSSATFTVSAAGTAPLSYQWRLYGTNLSGATASGYTRANAQPADAGPYSVVVTNAYGTAISSNALLTVLVPPTITTQPLSQTVTQGTAATFSVAASGTAPFGYQWRFNGGNISGATASTYTRSNAQLTDAGSYSAVVTNLAGSATSADAILTVTVLPTPPAITTQPQGQTVLLGGTASFNVVATGTAPLAYQWRFNGADIAGATASSYSRSNLQGSDTGDYSVLVTNLYGSLLSANATLIVDTNITLPVITAQPQSQTAIAGQSATFTVTATNKAAMGYQWRFNSAPIAGATGTAYTVANAQTGNAGSYSVVITNIIGPVTSADAVLAVNFSLAATATAGGSVSKSPDQASYSPNAVVTLAATPNANYLFTGWSGDASGTNNPLDVTLTANKSITANFVLIATDIILDNTDPATTFEGIWQTSSATAGYYGVDYRFAVTAAGGLSNVIFRPYISTPAYYDVYEWHTTGSNRATNAPWSIVYDGGTLNVGVNQQLNNGTWVLIGSALPFLQGTNGYVKVSNSTTSGTVVMADAVRFVLITNITLTATANGGGAVYKYPDQATYDLNSAVSVIAAPVLGWSFTGWSGGASGSANPLFLTLTHPLSVTASFASTVPDLIVDNTQATKTGTWTTRTLGTGYYSNDFQTASTRTSSANATSTFTPTIITPGNYDVYVWYPTPGDGTTSANAPFTISYSGGTTTIAVNQQTSQQTWHLLASGLKFAAGTSGYVRLANNTGESSRRVLADAVRWVYSANQDSPPVIIAQPQGQTADAGSSATFTASAAGTASLSYQWRFNGADIGGATASTYTRNNLQPADAGSYTLVVTNAVGSVTSSNAVLTVTVVNVAPTITLHPYPQDITAGQNATFTASATGAPAPGYQWRKNGTPIGGATGTSYTVANAQPADAGTYSVVATNIAGSATSTDALLTVNVAPAITGQPTDQNVNQTSNAVFSVAATGTPAPAYQWRKNGIPIGGATGTSYTVLSAQPADAASYSVVVSNIAGIITSADAVLTVNVAPTITAHPFPQDLKVNEGSDATFTVIATGTPAPSYQWRFNGTDIGAATGSTYTRSSVQPADAGSYSVLVSNIAGTVTSADALLTVNVAPGITTQPQDQNVNQGSDAVFSVVATGTPAPSYQWWKDGAPIGGATGASCTVANAQPADAGSYSVVVTNIAGSVTSSSAILAVNVPPDIATHPQDLTVNQGADAVLTVVATGTAPLAYQWYFSGLPIAGATTSAHTVTDAQATNAGVYAVEVLNVAGQVTSSNANLTVNLPPAITAQPQNLAVGVGSNATFTVTATGTAPLCYQWRFNGTNLAYATGSAYTCANAQTADAGTYSVLVSNIAGTVTSDDALLAVAQPVPPQISGISLTPSGQIQLQVTAPAGHYAIDATTNLLAVDWAELTNFTTTGDAFQYQDAESGLSQRYYRVRLTP